jgi:hypothetical protein
MLGTAAEALTAQGDAEANRIRAEQAYETAVLTQEQAARKQYNAEKQADAERMKQEIEEVSELVPFSDKLNTLGKIGAIIAGALGGYLAVSTGSGRNMFNEELDKVIDRDLAIQKEKIRRRVAEITNAHKARGEYLDGKLLTDLGDAKLYAGAYRRVAKEWEAVGAKARTQEQAAIAKEQSAIRNAQAAKYAADALKARGKLHAGRAETAAPEVPVAEAGGRHFIVGANTWVDVNTPAGHEAVMQLKKRHGSAYPVTMSGIKFRARDARTGELIEGSQAYVLNSDQHKKVAQGIEFSQDMRGSIQRGLIDVEELIEDNQGVGDVVLERAAGVTNKQRAKVKQSLMTNILTYKGPGGANLGAALTEPEMDAIFVEVFGVEKSKFDAYLGNHNLDEISMALERFQEKVDARQRRKIAIALGIPPESVALDYKRTVPEEVEAELSRRRAAKKLFVEPFDELTARAMTGLESTADVKAIGSDKEAISARRAAIDALGKRVAGQLGVEGYTEYTERAGGEQELIQPDDAFKLLRKLSAIEPDKKNQRAIGAAIRLIERGMKEQREREEPAGQTREELKRKSKSRERKDPAEYFK